VRVADFFSGKGNSALSSLAAAAGGGVTIKTRVQKNRIGRAAKKRQLAWIDKVRKQDADMRDLRPVTYRRRRGILPSPVETFC
jgi:hypothetical protein